MNSKIGFFLSIELACAIAIIGCIPTPSTSDSTFRSCLGFGNNSDWVVLSRPNSIWTTGTIVEIGQGKEPNDKGDFKQCLPGIDIKAVEGTSPETKCGSSVSYNISLSGTVGLSQTELAKMGLIVGGDKTKPNYTSRITISSATERRLNTVPLIEDYIGNNYNNLSRSCQLSLTDASRFVIDKVYQIDEGSIEIEKQDGTQVDVTAPMYKVLRDAAIKSGFSVGREGGITVPKGSKGITFAVRVADFNKVLTSLGIERRGVGDDFAQRMHDAGASVQY